MKRLKDPVVWALLVAALLMGRAWSGASDRETTERQVRIKNEQLLATAETKIQTMTEQYSDLAKHKREQSKTYKRRIARLLGGQIVFDTFEGTADSSEVDERFRSATRSRIRSQKMQIRRLKTQIKQLAERIVKTPYRRWNVAYSAGLNWSGGDAPVSHSLGGGLNFKLAFLDVSASGLVDLDLGGGRVVLLSRH